LIVKLNLSPAQIPGADGRDLQRNVRRDFAEGAISSSDCRSTSPASNLETRFCERTIERRNDEANYRRTGYYIFCWPRTARLGAANPPDAPSVVLIQNATVLTVSHGTIEHGSILIRWQDRRSRSVHQGAKDAQIIDAAGQFVMPGIIDCHSHIAVDGSASRGSVSVSSMANIAEVIDSDDIDIYRDLAGGVTAANILHGSANSIGGQTEVIKLRWGQPAAKLPFEGALRASSLLWAKTQAFELQYSRAAQAVSGHAHGRWKRLFAARSRKRAITRRPGTTTTSAFRREKRISSRRAATFKLDPLVEVLEGKRYVHSHCYREDEILMLASRREGICFKVRTFQHVLEGYKVAMNWPLPESVASTFSDWWAYKVEAYDVDSVQRGVDDAPRRECLHQFR